MNRNRMIAALGMTFLALLAATPAHSQALPKVFVACYVQNTGTTYRIREPGLPTQCTNLTKHVEFSWVDGIPGHDHGVLNGLADDDHPQYLLANGSRPLAGDLQLGSFRITGLAAGTGPGDAVRFEQAVKVGQAASGDLSGAYPGPLLVARLQGQPVASTAPTNGQVLAFDGTAWTPVTPTTGTKDHGLLDGLTDDDHPQYLLTTGIRASNGLAITGKVGNRIPIEGAGVRLLWHPGKAAFRAGMVDGREWDDVNVGQSSTALGWNTTASGDFSTALGANANTNGQPGSFVYGDLTTKDPAVSSAPNQFLVRAAGGLRLFNSVATDRFTYEHGTGTGCEIFTGPRSKYPGSLTCTGEIEATEGGFRFPDGTIQATAATAGTSDHGSLSGLTDDDHPQYLLGDGVRGSTNGFAVTGTVGTGTVPVSGAGARLMWAPGKAAFRAGHLDGSQSNLWDDDGSVGVASTAFGFNSGATGAYSFACCASAIASGQAAAALGSVATASDVHATAIGNNVTASGPYSTALGFNANTNGMLGSLVYGDGTGGPAVHATAPNSFVVRAQNVWFGRSGDQPASPAGYFTADGVIASTSGGFKFPDGTIQTTAVVGPGSDHGALSELTDDDHPQYLLGDGARASTSGFAVTGTPGVGAIPVSGPGARLMWSSRKAAVRAGLVIGSEWDEANIGFYSTAFGGATTAVGDNSTAMGNHAIASGQIAFAVGDYARASGPVSTAMGSNTTASGAGSTAIGQGTMASGNVSTAIGQGTVASGNMSTAIGVGTVAEGNASTAMGLNTVASGNNSTTMGTSASANRTTGSFVYGDASTLTPGSSGTRVNATVDNSFVVRAQHIWFGPNGSQPESPAGYFTADGVIASTVGGFKFPDGTVQTTASIGAGADHGSLAGLTDDDHPQYLLGDGVRASTNGFAVTGTFGVGAIPASGPGVRLMWYPGKEAFRVGRVVGSQWDDANVGRASVALGASPTASGELSVAMGGGSTASGVTSTAMGASTTASGNFSTAMGSGTTASGDFSTALGLSTQADGFESTAMGLRTTASGNASTATGYQTAASEIASTAMGRETAAGGPNSTAMGYLTRANGTSSTAMGEHSDALGFAATAMGWGTEAIGDHTTAMGRRASADGHTGSFVYGDASSGDTDVKATADNSFVVRAQHVWFGQSGDQQTTPFPQSYIATSTGAILSTGGSWINSSDVNRKENFHDEDGDAVLERLARVPIRSWTYKAEDARIRHLGPTAQDFYAAFQLGGSDKTISTVDAAGVGLLAIQALERRTHDLAARVAELDSVRAQLGGLSQENAELRSELIALREQLAELIRPNAPQQRAAPARQQP